MKKKKEEKKKALSNAIGTGRAECVLFVICGERMMHSALRDGARVRACLRSCRGQGSCQQRLGSVGGSGQAGSPGSCPGAGEEQGAALLITRCFGVNPERRRRRAALQAGLFWETVDEGFVGGCITIDLTGMGLIKARSQLSLQPGQAALQMILLLFRNLHFSLAGESSTLPRCTLVQKQAWVAALCFPTGHLLSLGWAELSYRCLPGLQSHFGSAR